MTTQTPLELAPTARQEAVLDAVLELMVEKGDALTMAAVARRASCSKETLYKWFGDRDGLLTETVRFQASKVRVARYDAQHLDVGSLRESLVEFAENWLGVITSRTSIALNRLAISQAGSEKSNLGSIVLENGRFAIGERLKPLLEAARKARLLNFDDGEEAFRTFLGLAGRDLQIRILLGDDFQPHGLDISRDAERAVEQFLALYGAERVPASAG